jgi:hypothetical protein
MSTFDPMATAIDWFDTYRAGSLSIVDFYASEAEVECGCGGVKTARGQAAICEYWRQRFANRPAGALISLLPADGGIFITYRVPDAPVQTTLYFDCNGKITRSVCGPVTRAAP